MTAGAPDGVCAVILAAGEGTRLRPLTGQVPKALCPVGNVPLLDRALQRLAGLGLAGPGRVAVNACYLGDQVAAHVGARATVSVESTLLGTAGALGLLRDWIAGRGVLVGNADAYLADRLAPGPDIAALLDGWDGRTVRLLGQPAPDPREPGTFSGHRFTGFSLLPWQRVRQFRPSPPTWYARSGVPRRRPASVRWCPIPAPSSTPARRPTTSSANLHAAGGTT